MLRGILDSDTRGQANSWAGPSDRFEFGCSGSGRYRAVAAASDCGALLQPIQTMSNLITILHVWIGYHLRTLRPAFLLIMYDLTLLGAVLLLYVTRRR